MPRIILDPQHLDLRPEDKVAVRINGQWTLTSFVGSSPDGFTVYDSELGLLPWDVLGPPF